MTLNFNKICRTCMGETSYILPIYEEQAEGLQIIQLLQAYTTLSINKCDGLPENICLSCLNEVNHIRSFSEKCKRSDSTLRSYLKKEVSNTSDLNRSATGEDAGVNDVTKSLGLAGNNTNTTKTDVPNQENIILISDDLANPNDEILNTKSIENIFTCLQCREDFRKKEHIDIHICSILLNDVQNSLPTELGISESVHETKHPVSAQSVKETEIQNRVFISPPRAEYKCKNCGAGFVEQKSLNFHEKSKMCLKFRFTCEKCNRVFTNEKLLQIHKNENHPSEYGFQCKQCDKRFENDGQLHYHKQYHKKIKKHQCPQCDKGFNMLSTLKDHLRTHSGEKPFLCSICGRGFSQSTNLRQHMMRHTKTKPYQCSICNYSFVSKGELTAHNRTHTGDHPFVCNLCGTGFTTSSSMAKHKRIHAGVKKYTCEFCPLRFTALGTLKNHRRTHTGEKPFTCVHCVRSFAQKSDLVSHTRTHTGERPYICSECGLTFQQKSSLKSHQKRIHEERIFSPQSSTSSILNT